MSQQLSHNKTNFVDSGAVEFTNFHNIHTLSFWDKDMEEEQRKKLAPAQGLSFVCFCSKYLAEKRSHKRCNSRGCWLYHHRLLHHVVVNAVCRVSC